MQASPFTMNSSFVGTAIHARCGRLRRISLETSLIHASNCNVGPSLVKGYQDTSRVPCRRMECVRRKTITRCKAVLAVEPWSIEKPSPFIEEKMEFLKEDLKHLFDDQGIDPSAYDDAVEFVDPITRYSSAKGYLFNIAALRRVFDPDYVLLDLRQTGDYEITTRWTMKMRLAINPFPKYWPAQMLFTGVSILGINPATGRFNRHIDYWDALTNQQYFSLEAFLYVLAQLADVKRTPGLETPAYLVLKKTKQYEIRRYEPFLVAEAPMAAPDGSTSVVPPPRGDKARDPAVVNGGALAFRALAGYIFGANARDEKMKMTTPVFTDSGGRMQFVIGSQYKDTASLPTPKSSSVQTAERPGGLYAAVAFSGRVDDRDAVQKYESLKERLRSDGVEPSEDEWLLARYNDPSVQPLFRRNEVLVPVRTFDLWANNFHE